MNAGLVRNIVLVHGAFVDGSTWRGVYDMLKQDGYNVAVVQNPTLSLEGDAAATRRIIDAQDGPVVLVGHSYGGAVITEAGTDPKVAALVYIAAVAPDEGESANTILPIRRTNQSCRRKTASCSRIGRSFPRRSTPTSSPSWPRSWPTRRSLRAWAPETGRSPNPPGGSSRAGTWSRPRTG